MKDNKHCYGNMNKKSSKKIGFWIIWICYIVMFIADLVSTLYLGEIGRILETNMIYKYVGFTGITLLNLGIIWLFWWVYSRSKTTPTARFYLIMCMLMIISIRIFALQSVHSYVENPVTVEEAIQIATPEAKLETTKQIAYMAYPPFIFSIIGFLFWRLDHICNKK